MSIIESKPIVIRFETNYDVGEDDEEKSKYEIHVIWISQWRLAACSPDAHEQADVGAYDHQNAALIQT